jgi:hypothetical protein
VCFCRRYNENETIYLDHVGVLSNWFGLFVCDFVRRCKMINWSDIAKVVVVAVLTGFVFFMGYMIGAAVAVIGC